MSLSVSRSAAFPSIDENARLEILRSFRAIDGAPDPVIQGAARMAARLLNCPIALVNLIDEDTVWTRAGFGLDVCATPREQSFCTFALSLPAHDVLLIQDASRDPRFAESPFVTGEPHVRFYAGALLTSSEGANLGTLCVIDTVPRLRPTAEELADLRALADLIVREMERVRSERLMKDQVHLLTMSETMSGVGQWRLDVVSERVWWSDAVYAIHGVSRDTFDPNLGDALAFYRPEDRPILEAHLARALGEGLGFDFEMSIRRADGEMRRVVSRGMPDRDADGRTVTVFGVFQDVTNQYETLAAVERGRTRYKLLADNVADVIARIRLDGSASYISPAVQNLIGYTPAEMEGCTAQSFVHAPDRHLILDAFQQMAQGREELSVQHRVEHQDGRVIWVETRFRLVRDMSGGPIETVVVIRDISKRKALEDALNEARVAAEAAAAVKGEFLANMSHELRTPLTSIIGFTGLAVEQPNLPDLARDYIHRVDNASRALLCTVNDILDFSKLEAGQVAIRPQPTDIVDLCRQTLDLFTPQAGARDLTLTLDVAPNTGWILIDPDRVRQILLNLVGNAVKFTPRGGVILKVRSDADAGRLTVSVRDTGPGIAPEKLDRLFQRFSQIDGSLTRTHGGTGLGLAICKGLAEAMGGTIGADSAVGRGSVFRFDISAPPVGQAAASGGAADAPTASGPGRASLAGVRVLVADDHPANRELARLFLTGMGAEVSDVVDGQGAVDLAAREPFDVILMDMRMPRLDGLGALKRIRSEAGPNDHTPVLAFTADASDDQIMPLLRQGFDGVVAKPVSSVALIQAVVRAVEAEPVHALAFRDIALGQ